MGAYVWYVGYRVLEDSCRPRPFNLVSASELFSQLLCCSGL
jgi:hypothetical protein